MRRCVQRELRLLRRFFRVVAQLHDVALGEQDALEHLAPLRLLPEQELQVHPEVLHLLVLRVLHDRLRLTVGLYREALLVPADRLGLFDQRRDHAGEGARLGRELRGRFVILIESHGVASVREEAAGTEAIERARSGGVAWTRAAEVGCGERSKVARRCRVGAHSATGRTTFAVVTSWPTWRWVCSAAWKSRPITVDGNRARPTSRESSSVDGSVARTCAIARSTAASNSATSASWIPSRSSGRCSSRSAASCAAESGSPRA